MELDPRDFTITLEKGEDDKWLARAMYVGFGTTGYRENYEVSCAKGSGPLDAVYGLTKKLFMAFWRQQHAATDEES